MISRGNRQIVRLLRIVNVHLSGLCLLEESRHLIHYGVVIAYNPCSHIRNAVDQRMIAFGDALVL